MSWTIRLETPNDYRTVEELTREAFWGFSGPTCDEHYLAHTLRLSPSFIPALDFVALDGERLIGNVMYSKASVEGETGTHEVLTFGPLSVLPTYWRRGVGSALMRHSITEAARLGERAIVFYGHPDYYPRFGFRRAEAFGITAPSGHSFDALMAMPLYDGALDGVRGVFREDPLFDVNAEQAAAFNATFSPKEPAYMPPVSLLLDALAPHERVPFVEHKLRYLADLGRFSGHEVVAWGVSSGAFDTMNEVLRAHGYTQKPKCEICL